MLQFLNYILLTCVVLDCALKQRDNMVTLSLTHYFLFIVDPLQPQFCNELMSELLHWKPLKTTDISTKPQENSLAIPVEI